MPHQCLGCGRAFANGSMELLKGCPGCRGTRFFYTDTVLDDAGRAAKAKQAGGDLRAVLEQMAQEERLDTSALLSAKTFDEWLQPQPSKAAPPSAAEPAAEPAPPAPEPEPTPMAAPAPSTPEPERPVGTVQVHEPGSYSLDIDRLLAASPIIIEKEGVYMIHLASAFEAPAEGAAPVRRKR